MSSGSLLELSKWAMEQFEQVAEQFEQVVEQFEQVKWVECH